jgi:hypothetical protein
MTIVAQMRALTRPVMVDTGDYPAAASYLPTMAAGLWLRSVRDAASVAHQAASSGKLALLVDRRYRVAARQCAKLFAPTREQSSGPITSPPACSSNEKPLCASQHFGPPTAALGQEFA